MCLSAHAAMQTVWRIGTNDDPLASSYVPNQEFGPENSINDLPPGKVTRLPGDPLYNATNNPAADDDFYEPGTYPAGFNNLLNTLVVPNAEPDSVFKTGLTTYDSTNRIHFFLDSLQ